MRKIQFSIEGISPKLFNAPSEKALRGIAGGDNKKPVTKDEKEAEAMQKSRIENGKLCIPAQNLKNSIVDGSKKVGVKKGKGSIASYLKAVLFFETPYLYFKGKNKPDDLHEHWGRIPPRTGAAVMLLRPVLNTGWIIETTMQIMDDSIDPEAVKRCVEGAGLFVGIGAWRPEYGRFVIKSWKVLDAK